MAAVTGQFAVSVPWDAPLALLGIACFAALRLGADVLWVVLAGAGAGILMALV
jgi:hypothetical protein